MVADKQIRISKKIKTYLDKKKKHKRESYNDVIERELKLGGKK